MKLNRVSLRLLLLGAALMSSLMLAGPLMAQSTIPSAEDLRALRFYIEQKEEAAIQAEIRRLRMEFPGWAPPDDLADLLKTGPTTEIAEIYARLARNDIEGARRILQQTQARYPSWTVPADLQGQLDLTEGQVALDRAVNARDAAAAIRIASETPALLRCDRINNTWNLAELQANSGNASGALAAYRQIVTTCNTVPDIVATIEKAEVVTTNAQLVSLVDVAKQRFPGQAAAFDALSQRLLAGRGVQTQQPSAPAQPSRTRPADPAPAPSARSAPKPAAPAEPQPRAASTGSVPYATPNLTRLPRSGDGRLGQTRASAQVGNYRECLARSARPRSLDIAYERAWCAYNLERPLEAMAYFSAAAQGGLGSVVTRDARFGLALSFLKRDMTEDAARVAASTDFTLKQRREIESIILNQRGVQAYQTKDYGRAIAYFDALEDLDGSLPRDLALLRGYAYLNLKDYEAARTQILQLHNALATPETRDALKTLDASIP